MATLCRSYAEDQATVSTERLPKLTRHLHLNDVSSRERRDDMHPAASGSSTRGGSTSVRGRVRSPHISGGRQWLQPRAAAPWDRQTDRRRDRGIA